MFAMESCSRYRRFLVKRSISNSTPISTKNNGTDRTMGLRSMVSKRNMLKYEFSAVKYARGRAEGCCGACGIRWCQYPGDFTGALCRDARRASRDNTSQQIHGGIVARNNVSVGVTP